jgi:hypothetical protein
MGGAGSPFPNFLGKGLTPGLPTAYHTLRPTHVGLREIQKARWRANPFRVSRIELYGSKVVGSFPLGRLGHKALWVFDNSADHLEPMRGCDALQSATHPRRRWPSGHRREFFESALRRPSNASSADIRPCLRVGKSSYFLKGLILAQNERWRRGLGMQVERIPGASASGGSGERGSKAWVTYPEDRDSRPNGRVIPGAVIGGHPLVME